MRLLRRPEDLWESALDLTAVVAEAASSMLTCAVLAQVCLFTVVVRRDRRTAFVLTTLTAAVVSAAVFLTAGEPLRYLSVAVVLPWTGLVLGAGLAVRAHRDDAHALEQTAAATLAARESETVRRIADEHVRIARDLHDSVAHGIAEITVHAGAAEHRLVDDPQRALASIVEVRRTSRRVLRELRDVVVLRTGDEDVAGAPASPHGIPGADRRRPRLGARGGERRHRGPGRPRPRAAVAARRR